MMKDDDLLTASLDAPSSQPLYSSGALVAAAFFGGGFAVPLLAFENARRAQRLPRDLIWVLLGLVFATAAIVVTMNYYNAETISESSRNVRLASRAAGFLLAGGYYMLHRLPYRTMKMTGIDPPSPYVAVIVVVLASYGITAGLTMMIIRGALPLPGP